MPFMGKSLKAKKCRKQRHLGLVDLNLNLAVVTRNSNLERERERKEQTDRNFWNTTWVIDATKLEFSLKTCTCLQRQLYTSIENSKYQSRIRILQKVYLWRCYSNISICFLSETKLVTRILSLFSIMDSSKSSLFQSTIRSNFTLII